jgi:uncharacterized membrane protein
MIRILVPLLLAVSGLSAGVMWSTVIGMVPLTMRMPYDQYVQTIKFLWPRYDPFMPIVNVAAAATAAVLAFTAAQAPRLLFSGAAALLVAVMAISLIKNLPINRYVTSLDPTSRPADWDARDPRRSWRTWNLVRTVLALLALGASGAAAALV